MPKEKVSPRINPNTKDFFNNNFRSLNAGVEYALESFHALYQNTMHHMKGRFSNGELSIFIDVSNSLFLNPGLAGQQVRGDAIDGCVMDGLDEKWKIDKDAFFEKLRSTTIFEFACIEIWAKAFWETGEYEKDGSLKKYVEGLA